MQVSANVGEGASAGVGAGIGATDWHSEHPKQIVHVHFQAATSVWQHYLHTMHSEHPKQFAHVPLVLQSFSIALAPDLHGNGACVDAGVITGVGTGVGEGVDEGVGARAGAGNGATIWHSQHPKQFSHVHLVHQSVSTQASLQAWAQVSAKASMKVSVPELVQTSAQQFV